MRPAGGLALLVVLTCGLAHAQAPASAAKPQASAQTATSSTPLTLAEAEAIALQNNPQITVGRLRALIAGQYVRESRSALLPNAYLSLTGVEANPGSRIAAGFLNNPILFPRAAGGIVMDVNTGEVLAKPFTTRSTRKRWSALPKKRSKLGKRLWIKSRLWLPQNSSPSST